MSVGGGVALIGLVGLPGPCLPSTFKFAKLWDQNLLFSQKEIKKFSLRGLRPPTSTLFTFTFEAHAILVKFSKLFAILRRCLTSKHVITIVKIFLETIPSLVH